MTLASPSGRLAAAVAAGFPDALLVPVLPKTARPGAEVDLSKIPGAASDVLGRAPYEKRPHFWVPLKGWQAGTTQEIRERSDTAGAFAGLVLGSATGPTYLALKVEWPDTVEAPDRIATVARAFAKVCEMWGFGTPWCRAEAGRLDILLRVEDGQVGDTGTLRIRGPAGEEGRIDVEVGQQCFVLVNSSPWAYCEGADGPVVPPADEIPALPSRRELKLVLDWIEDTLKPLADEPPRTTPADIPNDATDGVVLLQAKDRRLTKLITGQKVEPAETARTFTAAEATLLDLGALERTLREILGWSSTAICRGALIDVPRGQKVEGIARRSRPAPDGKLPTVRDAERFWIPIDIDGLEMPSGTRPSDLRRCGEIARSALPGEFRTAACIVGASGSHGVKTGIRVRLYFWASRAITTAELKVWLKGSIADTSIYSPEHLIFTAAPRRGDGRPDHLGERIATLDGTRAVEVPPELTSRRGGRGRGKTALPPIEDVEAALEVIENPDLDWDEWNRIAMAVWAATAGSDEGREALFRWSEKSSKYDENEAEQRWDGITNSPPSEIGFGSLVYLAGRVVPGWKPPFRGLPTRIDAADEFTADQEIKPHVDIRALWKPPALTADSVAAVIATEDRLASCWSASRRDRYATCAGEWYVREGGVYRRDETGAVQEDIRVFNRPLVDILRDKGEDRKAERIGSLRVIRAVQHIAASAPEHATRASDWDQDPFLLNSPSGVVDLRTGESRPHDASDRFMRQTSVSPDPRAGCPHWLEFLHQILQGDPDYVAYLRRWIGYSLTGSVRAQEALFLSGGGGNGKGTVLHVLEKILGPYCVTAPADLLTETRGEKHPTDLASLRGGRLLNLSELPDGRRWDEGRFKMLSGGDRIPGRRMHEDFTPYDPTGKLWISGNELPDIRKVNDAMRRRLKVAPFTYRPAAPDPLLREKLETELPGILAWAIDGTKAWLDHSLGACRIVTQATAEYFRDQDVIGAWLSERTEPKPGNKILVSALHASFCAFAADQNERGKATMALKTFSPELKRRKELSYDDKSNNVWFLNIALRPGTADEFAVP